MNIFGLLPPTGALLIWLLSASSSPVIVTGFTLPAQQQRQQQQQRHSSCRRGGTTPRPSDSILCFAAAAAEEEEDAAGNSEVSTTTSTTTIPSEITTKALISLYPALIEHKTKYGNPNIPLGSVEGRQCNLIRRMQIQNKLTSEEVAILKEMGFIFHSLEDVYSELDFDEMLPRLLQAKKENNNNLDIPKKYAPDPELGAYVTGIRRLGKERVDPKHVVALDEIDFVWVSSRKCGSKFMEQYRSIQKRLAAAVSSENQQQEEVFADPDVIKFIRSQKEAHKRGTLSETRIEYMTRLLGEQWWEEDEE